VYLAPTENHDLAESVPDVRRDEAGRWRLVDDGREWLPERLTLEPDEAVLGEYHLVASDDADDPPLVADEYRFLYQGEGFTVSVWETDAPGPESGSAFEDPQVPPLPNAETMAWYHEADAGTEVYLQPSDERVEAPACIEFELHNRSDERIAGNPYDWTLHKLDDGEWFRIAPWFVNQPLARIPPGDSDESELSLFHGDPMACEDGRGVGHLGGGRYAYRVGFGREGETHAALLDLEAPAVDPRPDDDVDVERDGKEIVVTTPLWDDDEHPPDAELVFERTTANPTAGSSPSNCSGGRCAAIGTRSRCSRTASNGSSCGPTATSSATLSTTTNSRRRSPTAASGSTSRARTHCGSDRAASGYSLRGLEGW
jgi:hypothetical protein